MRTRQDIEKFEDVALAPYAMKSRDSLGRVHREPDHPVRTAYQRDRDRIVHCEHFRKLEYKTQVFVIYEGDYYRTRLTHTIEVAQLARTIGRSLQLNEDLIEAIALAHDLGHPPFGHAGEEALNEIMGRKGLKFNHNQRSFDIVARLEKRYPGFDGLNLTNEVLIGILKHQTVYDKAGAGSPIKNLLVKDEGPTLEALVVDIADSLAYLNHDIDDGLTSGCLKGEDLMDSRLWQRAVKSIVSTGDPEMFKYQVVKALIDMQVRDLLSATSERLAKFRFSSAEKAKKYNFRNSRGARASEEGVVGFSPAMAKDRNHLQALLNEKFYHHYRVERMTSKAKRIIGDLFSVYLKNPKQLPPHVYPRGRAHDDKAVYRIICDYVASMTDRFALDDHKRLFNPYQRV